MEYRKYQAISKMQLFCSFKISLVITLVFPVKIVIHTDYVIIFVLRKPKKRKQPGRPDLMSYLSEKKELESTLRTQELEYKRDALEAETKLKQEQLEVEKRRISLQEQQMNMQLELLKALITSKK